MYLVDKNKIFAEYSDILQYANVEWTSATTTVGFNLKFNYTAVNKQTINILTGKVTNDPSITNIHNIEASAIAYPKYESRALWNGNGMKVIVQSNTDDDIISYEGLYLSPPSILNFGAYINDAYLINIGDTVTFGSSYFKIDPRNVRASSVGTTVYTDFYIDFNGYSISTPKFDSIVTSFTTKILDHDYDTSSAIYTHTNYEIVNHDKMIGSVAIPTNINNQGNSTSSTAFTMSQARNYSESTTVSGGGSQIGSVTMTGYGSYDKTLYMTIQYYEPKISGRSYRTYKFAPVCIPVLSCIV